MKNIKTKIKSVGLIIAMAVFSNLGFAQEELIVSATEGIVTEEIAVESSGEAKSPEPVKEENTVVTASEEKNDGAVDPVVTDEKETDNEKGDVSTDTSEGKEDIAAITDVVDEVKEANDESEEAKEIVINSLEETILFRFLQDFAFLRDAETLLTEKYVKKTTSPLYGLVVSKLPFASLNKKLYAKLIELAENERFPVPDLDIRAADEKDCWSYFLKTNPNLSDLFNLFVDLSFRKNFCNNNDMKFANEIKLIKEGENSIEKENLDLDMLRVIYANTLSKYKEFVKQNEEILKKIETIANNNFLIENDRTEKKCIKYRNENYCSALDMRPIKSLRELMVYVQTM